MAARHHEINQISSPVRAYNQLDFITFNMIKQEKSTIRDSQQELYEALTYTSFNDCLDLVIGSIRQV